MDKVSGLKKILCITTEKELWQLKEAIPEDFSLTALQAQLALILPAVSTLGLFLMRTA